MTLSPVRRLPSLLPGRSGLSTLLVGAMLAACGSAEESGRLVASTPDAATEQDGTLEPLPVEDAGDTTDGNTPDGGDLPIPPDAGPVDPDASTTLPDARDPDTTEVPDTAPDADPVEEDAGNDGGDEDAIPVVDPGMIGPDGGIIEGDGYRLTFPAGAIASLTEIVVYALEDGGLEGWVPQSRLFSFQPEGAEFARAVQVCLTVREATPAGADDRLLWTERGAGGYLVGEQGLTRDGEYLCGYTSHFSRGYVGRADACPDSAPVRCASGACARSLGTCPPVTCPERTPIRCADGSCEAAREACPSADACPEDCNDNGICVEGACFCREGFTGASCSIATCPDNCNGNGTCNDGVCACLDGFAGTACDEVIACPNDCSGNGFCDGGVCVCSRGTAGEDCSERVCIPSCSENGSCDSRTGTCRCQDGYTGPTCSEAIPCPNDCSGRGICTAGVCSCARPFSGEDCSIAPPCPNECSGNGICDDGFCVCNRGWGGEDCSEGFLCAEPNPYRCPDGTCVRDSRFCLIEFDPEIPFEP